MASATHYHELASATIAPTGSLADDVPLLDQETGILNDIAAVESTMQVEEPSLPQLDTSTFASQIFWLFITFAVLYVLISRSALPKIHDIVDKRRHRLERDLDRAERISEEARQSQAAYERLQHDAKEKALSMITVAQAESKALEDRELAETDAKIIGMLKDADSKIQARSKEFADTLEQLSRDVTSTLVKELTGSEPTSAMLDKHLSTLNDAGATS